MNLLLPFYRLRELEKIRGDARCFKRSVIRKIGQFLADLRKQGDLSSLKESLVRIGRLLA